MTASPGEVGGRVLVVSASRSARMDTRDALQVLGYEVVLASSGAELAKRLQDTAPKLVVVVGHDVWSSLEPPARVTARVLRLESSLNAEALLSALSTALAASLRP